MARDPADNLVSTDWLAAHLRAPDVRVVDATYYLPNEGRSAREDYLAQHVPGAVFFDIDEIADDTSDLPHMLPPPEKFSSRVRKLGLGDGSRIVVYDQRGLMSAARVWWTFRVFGHSDIAVLDGGFPKWLAEGRAVESGQVVKGERHFTARQNSLMVRDKEQLLANLESRREQVLDARSKGRFEGSEAEPRAGLRAGHIPGSFNLPYTDLLDPAHKTFKSVDEVVALLKSSGIDLSRPVVTSCGSGLTACVLALGLHLAGHKDVAVYDGSWSEWGREGDTPVDIEPAGKSSSS